MSEEPGLAIAEAATRLGLSVHTLRYYERVGLIDPIGRDSAGRRRYLEADLVWFAFLIRLRQTGMPIADMRRYAALRARGAGTLHTRRELLIEHRRQLADQIAAMAGHLAALDAKITTYDHLIEQKETRYD